MPLPATDGAWTSSGWTAWRYQPGVHLPGRWHEIVAVGQRLHAALHDEPEPAFLADCTDIWAVADRVAWGELPAEEHAGTKHLDTLLAALRPVTGTAQLVHGDLTGNVLFHTDLPPLVIDLSPYWRPPAFATAVVIADALVFEGARPDVVQPLLADPDFPQHLLRALSSGRSPTTWSDPTCAGPTPTTRTARPWRWPSAWRRRPDSRPVDSGGHRDARPCRRAND